MAAEVLAFRDHAAPRSRDWSQQELAEFYRVEAALLQAGILLETDRGLSDEGDPWFVFCRVDSGDVFVHFARVDGLYVVDGAAFNEPARGSDFAALVRQLIARYPLSQARPRHGSNVFVHPAALLIALVGAAFFHSGQVKAAESHEAQKPETKRTSLIVTNTSVAPVISGLPSVSYDTAEAQAAAVILSAVLSLHDDLFVAVQTHVVPTEALDIGHQALVVVTPAQPSDSVQGSLHGSVDPASSQALVDLQAGRLGTHDRAIYDVLPPATASAVETHGGLLSEGLGAALSRPILQKAPELMTWTQSQEKPYFLLKAPEPAPVVTESMEAVSAAAITAGQVGDLLTRAVPHVDALPSALAGLINSGEHAASSAHAGGSPSMTTSVSSKGVSTPVAPAPVAHDPVIEAAISQFLAQVSHLEIMTVGTQIVLFDNDIFSPLQPDLILASKTFTFDDGSSVSLVGTSQEISHLLVH